VTVNIPPAEHRIMEALWARGPLTLEAIVLEVADQNWGLATVRTLIHRLQKREAIRSEKVEGRVRYRPVLARDDYLETESQGLLDRLFGGRLMPLVAHFAERKALSPEEIARLRALLDELDRGR
jgi:predicted transcriptional regulator